MVEMGKCKGMTFHDMDGRTYYPTHFVDYDVTGHVNLKRRLIGDWLRENATAPYCIDSSCVLFTSADDALLFWLKQ